MRAIRHFIMGVAFLSCSMIHAQEKKIFPYPINQKKLSNGLNVVSVSYLSPGIAAFYIIVRVGSRNEIEPGKTGFAHFFEHMMFRGTEKFPPARYNAILKSVGASANANTSLDRTIYHMTGNANLLDTMFMLESDRFMNLKYSEHDFKTEAGAVKGEYTKSFANPRAKLNEAVDSTAFKVHTYRHTTMGFWEDVVNMPNQYQYSIDFFNRFYRPENTTILVVGDVKPEKVNQLAQKYFGAWKPGSFQATIPQEPEQSETRYTHLSVPSYPPFLSLNYKAPAFNDTSKNCAALDIISTLLFSERSDLYKKLVLDEHKARYIGGGNSDSRDPNLFTIVASCFKEADLQYVKDEIVKALEQLKRKPVDADLLQKTKSNLRYSFAMSIDNPTEIAESLSHYIYLTGDPQSMNRIYDAYDKVTPEDIMNAARIYFVPDKLTIGTISASEKNPVQ